MYALPPSVAVAMVGAAMKVVAIKVNSEENSNKSVAIATDLLATWGGVLRVEGGEVGDRVRGGGLIFGAGRI